ncbi:hypothetical protein HYV88_05165 [Candidatus Woesearchaeota archaeon]|nr:hypothetical protein [Candidatus Woesearchaeota archaeon]
MILIWVLAILDGVVALTLLGLQFGILQFLAIPAAIYLFIKGLIFLVDPFSIIDIIIGIYILLMLVGLKIFLTYIFILYFVYKIFISFAA